MVMNLPPAHRVRRLRRRTSPSTPVGRARRGRPILAALSVVLALGAATPASANEYTINACQADRTNYSTQAFADFATRGMMSPKGGVGKTAAAFLVGNLLASHLKLRAIAVDANPGFGTLGWFGPDHGQVGSSLTELLDDAGRLGTAAEVRRYVARLPSGLHLLASSHDTTGGAQPGPDGYGELIAFLSCFYETVVVDLGSGVTSPLARLAIDRADQIVLVTTPDQLTATLAVHALDQLDRERTTVVVNRTHPRLAPELRAIEECLDRRDARPPVTLPNDARLAVMLDSGAYSLEALDRRTRLSVKRLGLAVAERLV
jgi:MinD-like ATPase involved in chromosome partitioning or flagellar assembly